MTEKQRLVVEEREDGLWWIVAEEVTGSPPEWTGPYPSMFSLIHDLDCHLNDSGVYEELLPKQIKENT